MQKQLQDRLPSVHPLILRHLPQKLTHWLPDSAGEARIEEPVLVEGPADVGPLPSTLLEINALPQARKHAIYRNLLPAELLRRYQIDPITLSKDGQPLVYFSCPEGGWTLEIAVWRSLADDDPVSYLHLADSNNNQIMVLFVQFNDPDAPRFDTDKMPDGGPTYFGTVTRNLPAETVALQAGLAPGQVRQGLSLFRAFTPTFEGFITRMGHDMYFLEPLAYHSAILFERAGFGYVRGQREMTTIHQAFMPGGDYHRLLTPDNPFRALDAWKTIRGRSWAIHDGIMGQQFDGFGMVKHIGRRASVDTAPGILW